MHVHTRKAEEIVFMEGVDFPLIVVCTIPGIDAAVIRRLFDTPTALVRASALRPLCND